MILTGQIAAALLLVAPALFAARLVGWVGNGTLDWLTTWGAMLAFAASAAVCLTRAALCPGERSQWGCFGLAGLCWTAANLYYALAVYPGPIPLPSPADIGYFSFPWAVAAGIGGFARRRVRQVPVDALIDAVIATLAIAAVTATVMYAVVTPDTHNSGAVITTVIYPTQDVILLGLFAGVASLFGWRITRRGVLVALALGAVAAGDAVTFGRVLGGGAIGGAWANLCWTLGTALLGIAAWQASRRTPRLRARGRLELALPVLFAAVALIVVVIADVLGLGAIPVVLAAAALAGAFVRLLRLLGQSRELADNRRLALTDDLTGLPNRRRLLADLAHACRRSEPRLLALYDLDGFKHYNDTHGHPGGDRLLGSLAAQLRAGLPSRACAYRLGGDEFCVLLDAGPRGQASIADGASALADSGPGWSVTASYGTVELPREAADPSAALRLADQRMYAAKSRRPGAARQQARNVLLTALAEQQPVLHAHVGDVTALAAEVARALGMAPEDVDDVVRAGELHDIGKLAIPVAILDKPGRLDPDEWAVMRRHTVIGERMLLAAPALAAIAPLVRASHERWDGDGYPDGLAGEAIPLGARIVAVCDAYDAMIAQRPYRPPRTAAEAAAELRRCAGGQFDPRVVEAFLSALGVAEHPPLVD